MLDLHHNISYFLMMLAFIIFWFLMRMHMLFVKRDNPLEISKMVYSPSKMTHNTILEVLWTLMPCLLLVIMTMPSMTLIYSFHTAHTSDMVMKVMGNQWWWTYEYETPNSSAPKVIDWRTMLDNPGSFLKTYPLCNKLPLVYNGLLFPDYLWDDSKDVYIFVGSWEGGALETKLLECRLMDDIDLAKGNFSLLETSPHLILPSNLQISLLVTSNDVLHSWTVPSMGVKIDACPGRLNEIQFLMYKPGLFFGQCSEICGFYHGFMPMVMECTNIETFLEKSGYTVPLYPSLWNYNPYQSPMQNYAWHDNEVSASRRGFWEMILAVTAHVYAAFVLLWEYDHHKDDWF